MQDSVLVGLPDRTLVRHGRSTPNAQVAEDLDRQVMLYGKAFLPRESLPRES